MEIDLHSHTAEHSGCCQAPAVEMIRAARQRGLEGLVISDHHYHLTEAERDALQQAVPGIRLFRGIEISIADPRRDGVNCEDLVVISEASCEGLGPVHVDQVDRLVEFVERTGALTILAHPFRYHDDLVFDLDRFAPDAIEIASPNVVLEDHDRIAALARHHGMNVVASADAHSLDMVGLYGVDLDGEVATERELADAVRSGAFALAAHDETFQARARRIREQEKIARQVLAEGGGADEFLAAGGRQKVIFDAVARGRSLMPDRRAIGLRNPI